MGFIIHGDQDINLELRRESIVIYKSVDAAHASSDNERIELTYEQLRDLIVMLRKAEVVDGRINANITP